MNYIYERMEAGGETAIFDRADLRKFEDYVANKLQRILWWQSRL